MSELDGVKVPVGAIVQKQPLTVEQILQGLDRIHDDVQTKFHDQWDWMDAAFYVEALRTHIERLREQLQGCAIAADSYADGIEYGKTVGYEESFKKTLECRHALDRELGITKDLRERMKACEIGGDATRVQVAALLEEYDRIRTILRRIDNHLYCDESMDEYPTDGCSCTACELKREVNAVLNPPQDAQQEDKS